MTRLTLPQELAATFWGKSSQILDSVKVSRPTLSTQGGSTG
jgi:hypothetical protein